ncbi:hypothetical protein BZA05DRAFT_380199 [Tricharina praecox]|uniref:uncharacterized protein n=1 Tax=Tricharina praecox TaxID=43433 RepID=UPI0022202C5F|nr:uncharacterized protein BZA05DRAFT_380199 [Tricharina praecox]KAI5842039.1 hypothetical protein BZA05DRAFT_380199 [Tricharina praecox]
MSKRKNSDHWQAPTPPPAQRLAAREPPMPTPIQPLPQSQCRFRTLRISSIPLHVTKDDFRPYLKELLGYDDFVFSLVPTKFYAVATVTLTKGEPACPDLAGCTPGKKTYIAYGESGVILAVDCDFLGMTPLYSASEPTVDLVAVTGLAGHAYGSWKSRNRPHVWLRDFLPHDLDAHDCRVRVLTFGYNSALKDDRSTPSIQGFARLLLDSLNSQRQGEKERHRPIIFIGHSLGGLIIKQALADASHESEKSENDQAILDSCTALFLFGVPHRGLNIKNFRTLVKDQKNEHFIGDLRVGSDFLRLSHQRFSQVVELNSCQVISFFECRDTQAVVIDDRTGCWKRSGEMIRLVTQESATFALRTEATHMQIGIDADHSNIVKFDDNSDHHYSTVRDRLLYCVEKAPRIIESRLESVTIGANFDDSPPGTEQPSSSRKSFDEFRIPTELPFSRNQNFCGREDLIERIHEKLHPTEAAGADAVPCSSTERNLVTLYGLGGIGKTQVALEYAYRYEAFYSAILWVDARDPTVLETSGVRVAQQLVRHYVSEFPSNPDYIRIANDLGIPGGIDISGTVQRQILNSGNVWPTIKRWLQKKGNDKWLLLVDNHDDLETVNIVDYLPTSDWARIIVTSRRSEIQSLGHSISVAEMEKDVGLAMLMKAMRVDVVEALSVEEIKDAEEVVEKLGGLPLAISQAASYILMTEIDFKTYLLKLKTNFKRIASKKTGLWMYRNEPVFTCWEISFHALCPSATRLLHMCAFLSNEDIPDELFRRGSRGVEWLGNDKDAFDNAIEDLLAFSLVKRRATSFAKSDSFWIHPLVHQWARDRVDDSTKQRTSASEAIFLITAAVITDPTKRDTEYWGFERRISNHIELCAQNIEKYYPSHDSIYPEKISQALYTLSRVNYYRCKVEKSIHLVRRAIVGLNGLEALAAIHLLGVNLSFDSQYSEALEWYQRALEGTEKALGKDHPSTLTTVLGMAGVFERRGEYDKALEWYQRALEGTEKALGKDHPSTLTAVYGMAGVFERRGEYDKALEWYQRDLEGIEKALGKDHPSTLSTVLGMAGVFERRGEYDKALEWYQRALEGTEKVFGKDHPSTLTTVLGMAGVFVHRGEYDKALEWYQRALEGIEKALGKDHPSTLTAVYGMAGVFERRGEYDKALEWYQRALEGTEKALGKDHPSTLTTVLGMAGVFERRGEYDKALEWYQRALEGIEKALGKDHPCTLTAVYGMAGVFERRGEYDKALEWYQRALEGTEKALGKDHPSTLTTVHGMAGVFERRGEYDKALEWYQRALEGTEKVFGKDHPSTLTTVLGMAGVFERRGEYDKALEWYQRALEGTEKALGKDHPSTLTAVYGMAGVFERRGEYDKALEWYQRDLEGIEKALGKDHPSTLAIAKCIALLPR